MKPGNGNGAQSPAELHAKLQSKLTGRPIDACLAGAVPIENPPERTDPFVGPDNPDSRERGHLVAVNDDGDHQCVECEELRPRGGWDHGCPGAKRIFPGG